MLPHIEGERRWRLASECLSLQGLLLWSSPSDVVMALTVKLSCIFIHVSVVKGKLRHGELPFPVVTAVLNLGFDECY